MDKSEIRRTMKRLNIALDARVRASASERIFEAVEELPAFEEAKTVAFFSSLPDEPDTKQVLERWAETKRVVLPRVEGDTMQFYDYSPTIMERGAFGIEEPQPSFVCAPSQIDLIVVPGTAFTPKGARMGRGRGYYDKYMSDIQFRAYKAGVCYPHQLTSDLPVEPHDIQMDCVLCGE